jgi:hypothetical protein
MADERRNFPLMDVTPTSYIRGLIAKDAEERGLRLGPDGQIAAPKTGKSVWDWIREQVAEARAEALEKGKVRKAGAE